MSSPSSFLHCPRSSRSCLNHEEGCQSQTEDNTLPLLRYNFDQQTRPGCSSHLVSQDYIRKTFCKKLVLSMILHHTFIADDRTSCTTSNSSEIPTSTDPQTASSSESQTSGLLCNSITRNGKVYGMKILYC